MNGTTPEFTVAAELRGFTAAHQADVAAADDGVREWIHPDSPHAPLISELIGWYAGIDLWALYDRSRILHHLGEESSPFDRIHDSGAIAEAREAWAGEGGDAFFGYFQGTGSGDHGYWSFVNAVRQRVVDHFHTLTSLDGEWGVIGELRIAMTRFKEALDTSIPGYAQRRRDAVAAETPEGAIRQLLYVYNANITAAEAIGFVGTDVLRQNLTVGWENLVTLDASRLGTTDTDGTRSSIDGDWSPE